jgi:hypothetical protein
MELIETDPTSRGLSERKREYSELARRSKLKKVFIGERDYAQMGNDESRRDV